MARHALLLLIPLATRLAELGATEHLLDERRQKRPALEPVPLHRDTTT
jgi:hypothetical protein